MFEGDMKYLKSLVEHVPLAARSHDLRWQFVEIVRLVRINAGHAVKAVLEWLRR